jgi:transcription factor C subunit 7
VAALLLGRRLLRRCRQSGLSTFKRREASTPSAAQSGDQHESSSEEPLAEGTTFIRPRSAPPLKKLQSPFATQSHPPPTPRPFLHCGTDPDALNMDSGRHFDGEEAFNTGPMAPPSEPPANVAVTKLLSIAVIDHDSSTCRFVVIV